MSYHQLFKLVLQEKHGIFVKFCHQLTAPTNSFVGAVSEDRNSTYFDEYRKLLPDEYAKSHQTAKKKNEWYPVFDKFKPLLEKSKRKAYTKREAKLG